MISCYTQYCFIICLEWAFGTDTSPKGRPTNQSCIGGENIYPLEIEERLMAHPSISLAVVVGLKDEHYGEVVGTFLDGKSKDTKSHLSKTDVREWVTKRLGKHKAPAHVFWMGEGGGPAEVPLTGSGKVRKFELAKVGEELLKKQQGKEAKL